MVHCFGKILSVNTSGARVSDPTAIDREQILRNNLALDFFGMAWWDEKHIKQVVGEINGTAYQFATDINGVYDQSVELEKVEVVSNNNKENINNFMNIFFFT